jgi:hypothetical protein
MFRNGPPSWALPGHVMGPERLFMTRWRLDGGTRLVAALEK